MSPLSINESPGHRHFNIVVEALSYLIANQVQQPGLDELAKAVGMSPSRLQRVFSDWVGISPKNFLQYLTKESAKWALRTGSVFEAAIDSGLSSGSRLHDLFVVHECVTPGEFKAGGEGIDLIYGASSTPFGYCFVAVSARGVCKLSFFDTSEQYPLLVQELRKRWSKATLIENQVKATQQIDVIFSGSQRAESGKPVKVLLSGTPFRLQVWEALLRIPPGEIASYQQVAQAIGRPEASRAVAGAIAANELGYLVPCHRVIRDSGVLSGYRWGVARKAALLGMERSGAHSEPQKE